MKANWTVKHIDKAAGKHEGLEIRLLSKIELYALKHDAPDTMLIAIDGDEVLAKNADDDTRFGYVAFGVPVED